MDISFILMENLRTKCQHLKKIFKMANFVSALLIKTNYLGRSTTVSLKTNLFITVSLETNPLYHSFSFVKQPYLGIFKN